MSLNEIIIYLMVIFMILGAIDRIIGNKFGLGQEFESGIMALGSLALAMVGIISLAPGAGQCAAAGHSAVLSALRRGPGHVRRLHSRQRHGGAPLAMELAETRDAGLFGGLIVGSMLGPTLVFTIPVALGILQPEDRPFLAKGVLAGMITIPIGSLVGGLVAGFSIKMILVNLIPIAIFAALIILGLIFAENGMIKGFTIFGKLIVIVITIGLAAAIVEALTGFVVIPGMAPISEGMDIVANIAIVLAGAFPLVYVITKVFRKPLMKLGGLLGMNDVSAAGMVASLANSIPMFGLVKDMDSRGKIINVAILPSPPPLSLATIWALPPDLSRTCWWPSSAAN